MNRSMCTALAVPGLAALFLIMLAPSTDAAVVLRSQTPDGAMAVPLSGDFVAIANLMDRAAE